MLRAPIDDLVLKRIREAGPQDGVTLTLWLTLVMPEEREFEAFCYVMACSLRRLAAAGSIVLDQQGIGSLPGRQ